MGWFLIVDDNDLVRRALASVLGRYGECQAAGSANDAEQWLASGTPWDAFVIDIRLGDGSGLDVLATARRSYADTPAVVLSGNLDREAVNRAAMLDARFVCKPCGTEELAPFLSDVLTRTTGDRIYAATERARHRWGLSPRETEIVAATLRGRARDEYVEETGMSVNTFKTHVRKLLDKADYANLSSLAIDLLTHQA
ncbi:MAG: response regulator transcription factor [Labilithrix sp.]|nr:response regulator transcription factor [Labilithrix sp.]MBX3224410.1 response regulator transcription factor [Labilithrix sp.]